MQILKSTSNKFAVRGAVMLLGLLLLVFFVYPPVSLFFKGSRGLGSVFINQRLLQALLNSVKISVGVFVVTAVIGGLLAWLVVKTDFPFKKMIENFSLVSFAIPPYILALSWLQVVGRNGYLERLIRTLSGRPELSFCPYSIGAVVVIMSLHLYPLMYMSIRNALAQMRPEFEHAALLSGARPGRVVLTITLPAILPNLISTGLLVFSRTMANFAVPALLCLPVGIEVVPTGIYSALSSFRIDEASALSLLLVALSTGLYIAQGLLLSREHGRHGGGRGNVEAFSLSGRRWPICAVVIVFFLIVCIVPFVSMFVSSFMLRWGLPLRAEYLTLNNYAEIFSAGGKTLCAFRNSFIYGGAAALFASVIGGGAAIAANLQKSKLGTLIEALASWPMAIPNTVLAVAAIFAWNHSPLRLYGTAWGIIVTYMVLFTPIIMKQVSGLLAMHDMRLVNAARTMGASSLRIFFTITLPLIASGFKAGILVCVMIALREIPISLMLYSSGQETVGVLLFGMQSQSYGLEMTSALAVIVIMIILSGNMLLKRGRRRGR